MNDTIIKKIIIHKIDANNYLVQYGDDLTPQTGFMRALTLVASLLQDDLLDNEWRQKYRLRRFPANHEDKNLEIVTEDEVSQ